MRIASRLNRESRLLTVGTEYSPSEIERALRSEGYSIGFTRDEMDYPLSEYLNGEFSLEPYLKYGDSRDLIAGVGVQLADGRLASTVLTPRSAAGPDLRYLYFGTHKKNGWIKEATLRVRRRPASDMRAALAAMFFDEALAAIRDQVQSKNRPNLLRVYDSDSSQKYINDGDEKRLVLFGYEGEYEQTRFRFARMHNAMSSIKCDWLSDTEAVEPFLDSAACPPIFIPWQETQPELVFHFSIRWSRVISLLHDLNRMSGGIYPTQTTISGCWHHAALISIQLLSFEEEGDPSIVVREVEELLQLLATYRAALLELRSVRKRQDKQWQRLFSDPLTERLFAAP